MSKEKFQPKRFSALLCLLVLGPLLLCACSGCKAVITHGINVLEGKDRTPPNLRRLYASSATTVEVVFDEPVTLAANNTSFSVSSYQNVLKFTFPTILPPGETATVSGAASDLAGNKTMFSGTVYGYNSRTPSLLITEITTTGTTKNPDRTEILVQSDGNLAGVSLYDGIRSDFIGSFIFPSVEVRTGDYIVVYWTAEEAPVSTTQGVLHFSTLSATNPSQYNGMQALYNEPSLQAELIDCVIYANHEGSAFSMFGTKDHLLRAGTALTLGHWKQKEGVTEPSGLYCVNSRRTTATRSICRLFPYHDTDTAEDWYICKTGGITFGADNTSEAYEP